MRPLGSSVSGATAMLAVFGVLVGSCAQAVQAAQAAGLGGEGLDEDGGGPAGAEAKGFFEHIASAIQNAIGNNKPTSPPTYTTTTGKPYPSTPTAEASTAEPSTAAATSEAPSSSGSTGTGCPNCPDSGYVFGPTPGSSSSSSSSTASGSGSSSSSSTSSSSSSGGSGDEDILGGVDWEDVFGPSNQAEVEAAQQGGAGVSLGDE